MRNEINQNGKEPVVGLGNEVIGSETGIKVLQSPASDVIVREVHDWELDILTDGATNEVKAVAFLFVGLAGGFLQNFWDALASIAHQRPMTMKDFTLIHPLISQMQKIH